MVAITPNPVKDISLKYEIERVSKLFTKQEIATFAGVSREEIIKFESGECLGAPLIRKLTEAYRALDARGFRISSPYK